MPEDDGKIGEYTEGHLLKRAAEVVGEKTKGSEILDRAAENRIPKFDKSGMCLKTIQAKLCESDFGGVGPRTVTGAKVTTYLRAK